MVSQAVSGHDISQSVADASNFTLTVSTSRRNCGMPHRVPSRRVRRRLQYDDIDGNSAFRPDKEHWRPPGRLRHLPSKARSGRRRLLPKPGIPPPGRVNGRSPKASHPCGRRYRPVARKYRRRTQKASAKEGHAVHPSRYVTLYRSRQACPLQETMKRHFGVSGIASCQKPGRELSLLGHLCRNCFRLGMASLWRYSKNTWIR